MDKNEYLKHCEEAIGVKMIPCESSNIEGFGYNSKEKTLWVAFKSNLIYKYDEVPLKIFMEFSKAESKGKYLNANIKSKFKYTGYELQS